VLEETDGMVYVYTKSDYENEVNIVNDIKRLASSAKKLKSLTPIDEAEDYCGVRYSQEQINTFDALETTGLKIITGGPGTGKTTLLNGFLWKYERDNPDSSILLCAPTGRAAMRMRESTGRDAFTVHKALGIRPFESKSFAPDTKKLDADCVVVDECSMLDEEIFCRLMGAVKNGALVLLLGDKDQLPSIGAGNVLSDLLQSGKIETYALTHIFRQNNSLIIENSRRISRGDVDIKQGSRFLIKRFQTEDDMVNYAANVGKNCKSRGVGDVKFFTPSRNRKFLSGTVNMNGRLQDMMNRSGKSVTYGCYTYYVGDKVVFNANDYEKGYYNGQEGIVTDIQEHNNMQYITIETDDGHINLTGTDMEDIELGYIMTAHKSQGSECKNAVVLIPLHPASLLKRQLLYVEVTRAKECVMILSERDALEQAISCKYEYERSTGLKEKLKKC
jgi:exodeoxyribonuclease V alpha subunit